jgi:hypothetical protein
MRVLSTRTNARRPARRLLAVSAVVFVAACGGDDEAGGGPSVDPTTTTGTTDVTTTTAPTSDTSSTTAGGTTTTSTTTTSTSLAVTTTTEAEPIPGMPTGPGDPLIPRQYGGLIPQQSDSDCDDLRRGPDGEIPGSFWDVARQVCLALTTGAEWPPVAATPEPPAADGPFASCLDVEVRAMIDAALAWHQQHPDLQPDVSYAAPGALSPCELQIYGLTAVLVGEQDFDGGEVGDVRIEFEIPSRPDVDADEIVTEVDGEQAVLMLTGVDPNRGTRSGKIILGGEWADGRTVIVVLRSAVIERQGDVELPNSSDVEPPDTTTPT